MFPNLRVEAQAGLGRPALRAPYGGDAAVATALLDRLLHHAVIIPVEGNSYRLREHAALIPEHMRGRMVMKESSAMTPAKRQPSRSRKEVDTSMPGREPRRTG